MPYGDANGVGVEMVSAVLAVVKDTTVLAGVCGTDPFCLMAVFLKRLKEIGFSGAQNSPAVRLIDGDFRADLEGRRVVYGKEVAMVALRCLENRPY
mgnify:CR=1 FL=1